MKQWTPGIKFNKLNKPKKNILQTDWPRAFWGHITNSIFLLVSMEEKINLIHHILFDFFKFKTSDNLIG